MTKPDPRGARRKFQFSLAWKDAWKDKAKGRLMEFLIARVAEGTLTEWISGAFRLIEDLNAGRTDVLMEYFPDLKLESKTKESDPVEVMLKQQGEKLDQFISEVKQGKYSLPSNQSTAGGLKPLGGAKDFTPTAPIFEDEDVVVVKKDENAGANANASFLSSVFGLQEQKQ